MRETLSRWFKRSVVQQVARWLSHTPFFILLEESIEEVLAHCSVAFVMKAMGRD